MRGLFRSMPPARTAPSRDGSGSWSRKPSAMKPTSAQSSAVANRPAMPASRVMISGKLSSPRRQRGSLVLWTVASKRRTCSPLVGLHLQAPEGALEPGQAVLGFLDHGFLRRRAGRAVAVRPVLQSEQGPQGRDVQPGPGSVDDPAGQVLHLPAGGEQQVAAVLGLAGG